MINMKKFLLAGTAIVAVSFVGAQAAQAADGATPAVTTTISTATTGDIGAGAADGAAGNNGDDGVQFGASTITVNNSSTITGGAGQAGPVDANDSAGNAGGIGGAGVYFPAAQDGIVSAFPTFSNNSSGAVVGGAGGAGGAGGDGDADGATGGNGGAGGRGVHLDSDYGVVSGAGDVTGGAGGAGGAANETGGNDNLQGGTGGDGGRAISVVSDNNTVTLSSGAAITGGAGGAGGASVGTAANVNGGNGGAGVDVDGASATLTIGSGVTVTGGAGGAAGAGGSGAAGAAGAAGVGVSIDGASSTVSNAGTVTGGGTGAAIAVDINAAVTSFSNTGTIGSTTAHTGDAIDIDGAVTVTALSNTGNGLIATTTGTSIDVTVGDTITTLTNSGTISTTTGVAVRAAGTVDTFNNTSGDVTATTGIALHVTGDLNTLTNTSGTFSSTNVTGGQGTVTIGADLGAAGLTITGGTISNDDVTGTTGIALNIMTAQAGTITNTGTIRSYGLAGTSAAPLATAVNFGFAGNQALSNSGTIRGSIVDSAASVATLTNTGTIVGAITLDGAAAHVFTFTSGTVTGAVTGGASTDTLTLTAGTVTGDINLAAGTNGLVLNGGAVTGAYTGAGGVDTLTLSGGTLSGNIELGAGANVVNVDDTFATGGTFLATGGTAAITVLSGGDFTANTAITTGAVALDVNNGGTLTVNESLTNAGAMTSAGTIEVAAGKVLTSATHVAAAGTYIFDIASAASFGSYVATGGGVDFTGATMQANVAGGVFIADGAELKIADGTANAGAVAGAAGLAVTDNSFILDFTMVDGTVIGAPTDNTEVYLIVDRASLASAAVAETTNNASVGEVMEDLGNGGNATLDTIQGNLAAASNLDDVNEVLESIQPGADNSAMDAAMAVTGDVVDMTNTRLAALRTGTEEGMAAGNSAHGMRVWVQGMGRSATQDERDGIDGYDATSWGGSIGVDSETASGAQIGAAFSYGQTDVDSDNANTTNSEIDSYQFTLYGTAPLQNKMFFNGMVGYVFNDVSTTRHNVGGVTGLTALGDFDANQFLARGEFGRDYAQTGGLTLTPSVMAQWTNYDADDYTETGAGGANLNVDSDAVDSFEVGLNVDAAWDLQNANGSKVRPVLSAGYRYDLVGDSLDSTSSFTGGGAAFNTSGMDPARGTLDLGAALKYYTTDNWELSADYDFEAKEDYTAHTGQVRAAYKF